LLRPCSSKSSEVPAVGGGRCSSVVLSSPRKLAARFHHSAEYFGTIPPTFFGTIMPSLPAVSIQPHIRKSHHALFGAAIFSFFLHCFDGSFPAPPPECSSLSSRAYGLNQLRYDLRKLKGHALLQPRIPTTASWRHEVLWMRPRVPPTPPR
jgi:hypothetical protein